MRKIHIHSNVKGDWGAKIPYGNLTFEAAKHADGKQGHSTLNVKSLNTLEMCFKMWRGKQIKFDAMDFHAHGASGCIYIGAGKLDTISILRFSNRHFDDVFRASARIEFLGCNVAEDAKGELFLARVGNILLRKRGGSVKGSTGTGFANPFSGKTFHPTGNWVTAQVMPGGAVTLVNNHHLHADLIRKELLRMEQHFGAGDPRISQHLREGKRLIGPAGSKPSYTRIYLAYLYMVAAQQKATTAV